MPLFVTHAVMRILKPFPPANAIFAAFAILLTVGLFDHFHEYILVTP